MAIKAKTMILGEEGIRAALVTYCRKQTITDDAFPKIVRLTLRPARHGRNENEIVVHYVEDSQ